MRIKYKVVAKPGEITGGQFDDEQQAEAFIRQILSYGKTSTVYSIQKEYCSDDESVTVPRKYEFLSQEVRDVAAKIGSFYTLKNGGNEEAAKAEVAGLHISKIEVTAGTVVITTGSAGILIGKKGCNVDALIRYLDRPVKVVEEVDPLHGYFFPKDDPWYDGGH